MLVPRKRTPRGSSQRIGRLASPAVPAVLIAAATVTALSACGSSSGTAAGGTSSPTQTASSGNLAASGSGLCGATAQVDSLTVQRSDALPGNHTQFAFPATEKVTSASQAQSVARSLCTLQQVPKGQAVCPADFGVTYQLTFADGSRHFPPVTVNAAGCELVRGLGATRRATTSTVLWQRLGTAIGIPHPNRAAFTGTSTNS